MGVQTRRRARSARAARRPAANRDATVPIWERRPLLVVTAIATLAALLDLAGQVFRPLWLDEAVAFWIVKNSVWDLLHGAGTDGTPPAYYLLLKLALSIAGPSELALRLVSIIAGVALVPATYLVVRTWSTARAALLAAALTAISPLVHYYAVEARNYALVQLEVVGIVQALLLAMNDPAPIRRWVWLAVAEVVLLLTHIYAVFVLPAVVLAPVLFGSAGTRLRRAMLGAAAASAAVAACSPWLSLAARNSSAGVGDWIATFWTAIPPARALLRSFELFGYGGQFPEYLSYLGLAPSSRVLSLGVTFALVAIALSPGRRLGKWLTRPEVTHTLLFICVVPLLGAWLYSYARQPLYLPGRYDTIVLPPFLMLLAIGLDRLAAWRSRAPAVIAAVMVLGLATLSWTPVFGPVADGDPQDCHAAAKLAKEAGPGDRVVALGMRQAVTAYYAAREGFTGTITSFPTEVTQHPGWYSAARFRADQGRVAADGAALAATLVDAARAGRAVWILADPPNDIDEALWDPLMKSLVIDDDGSDRECLLIRLKLPPG